MQDLTLAGRPYHLSRRNRQVMKARDLLIYNVYRVRLRVFFVSVTAIL